MVESSDEEEEDEAVAEVEVPALTVQPVALEVVMDEEEPEVVAEDDDAAVVEDDDVFGGVVVVHAGVGVAPRGLQSEPRRRIARRQEI